MLVANDEPLEPPKVGLLVVDGTVVVEIGVNGGVEKVVGNRLVKEKR